MKSLLKRPILLGWIVIISTILVSSAGYLWLQYKGDTAKEKEIVSTMNTLLISTEAKEIDVCKSVLQFEKDFSIGELTTLDQNSFNRKRSECEKKFNISRLSKTLDNCKKVISGNERDFSDEYLFLDSFVDIQTECTKKYLEVTFSTGSFFTPRNDFKSELHVDFAFPFYWDVWAVWSDEYLENRWEAKKRLASLLDISPDINIESEHIVFYPKKAIVNLEMKPKTTYSVSLWSFKTSDELAVEKKDFAFTTPENKYLGLSIENPVSLYMDDRPPKIELTKYNLESITETELKICRIDNETYAKIEILRGRKETSKDLETFFLSWIDNLESFDCKTKTIPFEKKDAWLLRQSISLDDKLWNPARSGLYYVTFAHEKDRQTLNKIQKPLFFGIIDSHITMKVSRNGEWYFFVNDFDGNPLAWQNVRAYVNSYKDFTAKYNRETNKRDITFHSPLDKKVLWNSIVLGKTGKDWVLKVDLNSKVWDAFKKTFWDDWNFEYNGRDESFFITAASDTNLSYNHSHWNSWIAPWNFGYKVSHGWYWGRSTDSEEDLSLSKWWNIEKKFYAHIYTDRKLYLPGESVYIKSVIRDSRELSIPKEKEFRYLIKDPSWKEIFNWKKKLSEFGSVSFPYTLSENAKLGNYTIILKDKDWEYGRWYFNTEVFKNPRFYNEIALQTKWLNWELVKITETVKDKKYSWRTMQKWKFSISWDITSKYYNWSVVKDSPYTYKVYKQYYYDDSYWDNCYWGCFYEGQKEFYTEWKWVLDSDWKSRISIDVDFESNYADYKYIVEVTVTDSLWDKITGSNWVIARLPVEYKTWNPRASIKFSSEKKFYKKDEKFTITWGLSHWKWSSDYDDSFVFIIKKKDYKTNYVNDVRWYKRPINTPIERIEKIMYINQKNFTLTAEGKLEYDFTPEETGEYVFEYAKLSKGVLGVSESVKDNDYLQKVLEKFEKNDWKSEVITSEFIFTTVGVNDEVTRNFFEKTCSKWKTKCDQKTFITKTVCTDIEPDQIKSDEDRSVEKKKRECTQVKEEFSLRQYMTLNDVLDRDSREHFSLLSYWDDDANVLTVSDNKLRIIWEKVSYKIWEKARFLIQLPFSKWKILWTVEKQWVIKKEYIDVNTNVFFKEVIVDDTFMPNAYIGVVGIPEKEKGSVPEYKVWYAEIVVDKSEKKTILHIKSDKKIYKPREKVVLNLEVKDKEGKWKKSELTVMVVDDSLISLMWNVDLNTLQRFYRKLDFQIQTSLTNLAMLKNYYFARPGIVWWSWFGNFKWWDSAVSSRTIFKNTAYYNPNIITDAAWKARVEFSLPDNLTNFRVMVISNSKDNFFGYWSENIEVRKNIVIEDKTPMIYRSGDKTEIWIKIFNTTWKEQWIRTIFSSKDIVVNKPEKDVTVPAWGSRVVTFWTSSQLDANKDLSYTISALGSSSDNSDKLTKVIKNKEFPTLVSVKSKWGLAKKQIAENHRIEIGDNVDLEKSKVRISFSNNVLEWVQKIIQSLLIYPYGCLEQTISTTYPNAVFLKFKDLFPETLSLEEAEKNLAHWVEKLAWMQLSNGWFAYWHGSTEVSREATPYALRRLVDMKQMWAKIPGSMIENGKKYLETNLKDLGDDTIKAETFYTLAKLWSWTKVHDTIFKNTDTTKFSRHNMITYTYGLILTDKKKYKTTIEKNITTIREKLIDDSKNYYYWSSRSDKWLFTSMLIDYWYSHDVIKAYIKELYGINWNNYYYSTMAKSNAFIAFAKYMEKYNSSASSHFAFSVGTIQNRDKRFDLGGTTSNTLKREFRLKDILQYKEKHIELKTYVLSWKEIFTNLTLELHPKEKLKIEAESNGIEVKRSVFKVLDQNKLSDCSEVYYWRKNKNKDCDTVFTEVVDWKYTKWQYYKVLLEVKFSNEEQRTNVALEDHIPSTFRIINSKFKTESSSIKKWNRTSWVWDHIEYMEDRVFANASKAYRNDALYLEYMVTPEFEGEFIYPPVSAYLMYDWDIRAHTKFEKIVVE